MLPTQNTMDHFYLDEYLYMLAPNSRPSSRQRLLQLTRQSVGLVIQRSRVQFHAAGEFHILCTGNRWSHAITPVVFGPIANTYRYTESVAMYILIHVSHSMVTRVTKSQHFRVKKVFFLPLPIQQEASLLQLRKHLGRYSC